MKFRRSVFTISRRQGVPFKVYTTPWTRPGYYFFMATIETVPEPVAA